MRLLRPLFALGALLSIGFAATAITAPAVVHATETSAYVGDAPAELRAQVFSEATFVALAIVALVALVGIAYFVAGSVTRRMSAIERTSASPSVFSLAQRPPSGPPD